MKTVYLTMVFDSWLCWSESNSLFYGWNRDITIGGVSQQLKHQFNGYLQGFFISCRVFFVFFFISTAHRSNLIFLLQVFQCSGLLSPPTQRAHWSFRWNSCRIFTRRVVVLTLQRGVLAEESSPGAATVCYTWAWKHKFFISGCILSSSCLYFLFINCFF